MQPEVAERGGEGTPVQERRDEEEEEGFGVELHPGEPGHEHQRQPGEDEKHRMRDPEAPGHQAQGRRDREQHDDELYAAHGGQPQVNRWASDSRSTSCWPPSMSKVAPVSAVLVMRWTASAAMSAGPTTRRIGRVARSCSRRASS